MENITEQMKKKLQEMEASLNNIVSLINNESFHVGTDTEEYKRFVMYLNYISEILDKTKDKFKVKK